MVDAADVDGSGTRPGRGGPVSTGLSGLQSSPAEVELSRTHVRSHLSLPSVQNTEWEQQWDGCLFIDLIVSDAFLTKRVKSRRFQLLLFFFTQVF